METYKTPLEQSNALVNDKNPFDTTRLDLKGKTPDKMFDRSRLINLTADEYYKLVANEGGGSLGNTNWKEIMENRAKVPNEIPVKKMEEMMRSGTKFPAPWIHMSDKLGYKPYFQEGLHRMLAAKNVYGENTKFPVWLGLDEESEEDYPDIDKGNIDDFIQKMNERRRQRQIDYDNAQWEKEQQQKELTRKLTAHHFKVPVEQVTPEMIKQYLKYEDDFWLED